MEYWIGVVVFGGELVEWFELETAVGSMEPLGFGSGSRYRCVFGRASAVFQRQPSPIGPRLFVAASIAASTKQGDSLPLEKRNLLVHAAVARPVTAILLLGASETERNRLVKIVPAFLLGIHLGHTGRITVVSLQIRGLVVLSLLLLQQ